MRNETIILNFVDLLDRTSTEDIKGAINVLLSYMNNSVDDGVKDMDKINRHKKILTDMLDKLDAK